MPHSQHNEKQEISYKINKLKDLKAQTSILLGQYKINTPSYEENITQIHKLFPD